MLYQMGTGNLAKRHGEQTSMFSGSKRAAKKSASMITKETAKAYKKIEATAKDTGSTPEKIALDYCYRHLDAISFYVVSRGEVPADTNPGLVAQACILRMEDIAVVASAANLSEDDALSEIQEGESEAVELSTADKDYVMNPDLQAAINCLIVELLSRIENKTGVGDIKTALNLIAANMHTPLNNAVGDGGLPALTPVDISWNTAVTPDTGGGSSSDFWDILNKIAGTASTVSGAVRDISNSTSGAILNIGNAVQTTGANTGASAISLYMQRNGLTILIISLLAIVLLIILIRVTRN